MVIRLPIRNTYYEIDPVFVRRGSHLHPDEKLCPILASITDKIIG